MAASAALLVAAGWALARMTQEQEVVRIAAAAAKVPAKPPDSSPVTVRDPAVPNGLVHGACVAFRPTGADRRQTVFLDPGHGGPDPGALGIRSDRSVVAEKDLTLALALQLRDQLRTDGFRVVLSRTADTAVAVLSDAQIRDGAITNAGSHVDGVARVACANAAAADVLVSLHFDAFSDPTVGGAETFYDDARDFAAANQRLATLLQTGMISSFRSHRWQTDDRGVISDALTGTSGNSEAADRYGRLLILGPAKTGWLDVPSRMPGALVEPLFITDPREADAAWTSDGRKVIADGLEKGITAYLAPPPASPPNT
jgi:N-acetylmuramoyl-L-alanine amidase